MAMIDIDRFERLDRPLSAGGVFHGTCRRVLVGSDRQWLHERAPLSDNTGDYRGTRHGVEYRGHVLRELFV